MVRRRSSSWIAVLTACAVVLAACGGDDDDTVTPDDTADVTEPASTEPSSEEPASEPTEPSDASAPETSDASGDESAEAPPADFQLDEPVRIIMNFGLPGSDAVAVPEHRDASALAVEQINAAGGIGGLPVEYEIIHTPIDPQEALTAINLAYEQNPTILMGGVSSSQVLAAARTIQDGGIPYIHFSAADNLAFGEEGGSEWSFRQRLSNEVLTRAAAEFMVSELGLQRIGIAYLDAEYGVSGAEALTAHIEDLGGEVAVSRPHTFDATDLTADVLEFADVDGVIAWTFPNQIALLLNQMKDNGISLPFMTTESGAVTLSQGLIDPETAAEMYAVSQCNPPASDRAAQLVSDYEAAYGITPDGNAAGVYDTIFMIKHVIEDIQTTDPEAIRDALREVSYDGQCTNFRGHPDTHDLSTDTVILDRADDGSVSVVTEILGS